MAKEFKISDCDDHLVTSMVVKIQEIMRTYPTISCITASYNVLVGLFWLGSVCGSKNSLLKLVDDLNIGLKAEIEKMYEH
jgi:hypothetical protein